MIAHGGIWEPSSKRWCLILQVTVNRNLPDTQDGEAGHFIQKGTRRNTVSPVNSNRLLDFEFFFLLGNISGYEFLKLESNATLALLVWSEFMLRAHSNNASLGLKGHESAVDHLSYKVVHRGLLMPRWPRLPQGDQGRPWKC